MTQTASNYDRLAGLSRTAGRNPWSAYVSEEEGADLLYALDYDPDTGVFIWKNSNFKNYNGRRADFEFHHGYRGVSRKQRNYYAHRVAWFFVHRRWQTVQIDHINTVRDDNRIVNLREADNRQNNANRPVSASNKSGIKGVYWKPLKGKWLAQISVFGKCRHLGYFDNIDDAAAYARASAEIHGEFVHPTVLEMLP